MELNGTKPSVLVCGGIRPRRATMVRFGSSFGSSFILILLLHGCGTQEWKVLRNDATETIPEHSEDPRTAAEEFKLPNNTANRPWNGVRRPQQSPLFDASELSCQELHSTRYITDGLCRSIKPVKELKCSGQCVPFHLLPNSILRAKWWRTSTSDYRCVPAHIRTQRVQLHCVHGHQRTYKIRTVTSCKCKHYSHHHNQSDIRKPPASSGRCHNKKHTSLPHLRDKGSSTEMRGNAY